MNTNKYIKGLFLATMAMVFGSVLTSCEDEPDKYEVAGGVPKVYYVRLPNASAADSLITEASLQTSICLVGENLRSVYELYFNDQKAVLNSSYISDNVLIVDIPKGIPEVTTNKIYMVTRSNETVTYDFGVVVPAPVISSMSCEYAAPGSKASFAGQYFVDDESAPLKITFTGGATVEDYTVANDASRSSVTFTVPEGAEPGPITVTSIYGTSETVFYYKDTRGMLFDFDDELQRGQGNDNAWHPRDVLSDETSLTGNFVQLGDGNTTLDANGGWNDSQFSFEYWCGSWDSPQNVTSGKGIALHNLVDFSDYKNMALKFEMYIPSSNPWSSGTMQVCFEGYDLVTISGNPIEGYSGTVAAANAKVFNGEDGKGTWGRAMYRPWTTTGSYHTDDQWVTVTLPLTSFSYNKDGGEAENVPDSPEDFASLTIFVVEGGIPGTECTPIFKIDNIRVVPNK